MNYAVYNKTTNKVITIVTAAQGAIPEGYEFIEEDKLPAGWTLHVEPAPVPTEVALWAFKAAAKFLGYLDQITYIIDQLPEPDKTVASLQWEYATVIERSHPTTVAIGSILGLTEETLDQAFRDAKRIQGY